MRRLGRACGVRVTALASIGAGAVRVGGDPLCARCSRRARCRRSARSMPSPARRGCSPSSTARRRRTSPRTPSFRADGRLRAARGGCCPIGPTGGRTSSCSTRTPAWRRSASARAAPRPARLFDRASGPGCVPDCALGSLAVLARSYAGPLARYRSRFPGLGADAGVFVAATDTIVRAFVATMSDGRAPLRAVRDRLRRPARVPRSRRAAADVRAFADPALARALGVRRHLRRGAQRGVHLGAARRPPQRAGRAAQRRREQPQGAADPDREGDRPDRRPGTRRGGDRATCGRSPCPAPARGSGSPPACRRSSTAPRPRGVNPC